MNSTFESILAVMVCRRSRGGNFIIKPYINGNDLSVDTVMDQTLLHQFIRQYTTGGGNMHVLSIFCSTTAVQNMRKYMEFKTQDVCG